MNSLLRSSDWAGRAQRWRWLRERESKHGWGAEWSEPFIRLFEELGGPYTMEPDGRYGPPPFEPRRLLSPAEAWRACSLVGADRLQDVYTLDQLPDDVRLMLWPWVAKLAATYAESLRDFDRDKDLSRSQIDLALEQIDGDAIRLAENLRKLQTAGRLARAWHPLEYQKQLFLMMLNRDLDAATPLRHGPAALTFSARDQFADDLITMARTARALRARKDDMPRPARIENAGKQALTCGAAYLWEGLGGTATAARRTSKKVGEESDFVLFVQSIARLTSNEPITIAQVDAALKLEWPTWEAMTKVVLRHGDGAENPAR